MPSRFLTAEWRYLAMLNYEVEPAVLAPYLPAGTELDSWRGQAFVSLVGFLFLKTRVLSIPIPGHTNFEEVNLRFYVRREASDGARRGVVFIKEIVPMVAIALVARGVYGENYAALPMRHEIVGADGSTEPLRSVAYGWRYRGQWFGLRAAVTGTPAAAAPGSEEEFITEHYWGYTRQRGGSSEYRVEHPRWRIWRAVETEVSGDVSTLYGPEFASCLRGRPTSAFVADGSEIAVYQGSRLPRRI